MEAAALRLPIRIGCQRMGREQKADAVVFGDRLNFGELQWKYSDLSIRNNRLFSGILHACLDSPAPVPPLETLCDSFDGNWLLKRKGREVASNLNGRCIFLVGMMGSGKTTVGKILSEALGYAFVDSDKYIEQTVGGSSVTQIFEECGENFFRDVESQALQKLSLKAQQVVATGGGAVIRPVNWEYMKQGITVFIKVPVDALARRIAAVGTESRPLLQFNSGDPYTKAFMGLFTISKKRIEAYSNADTTVSIADVAVDMGLEDVSDLSPKAIAIAVLIELDNYFRGKTAESIPTFT